MISVDLMVAGLYVLQADCIYFKVTQLRESFSNILKFNVSCNEDRFVNIEEIIHYLPKVLDKNMWRLNELFTKYH